MRLLVTGATGRLGSRLVRAALTQGWDVRAVDTRYRNDLPVPVQVVDLKDRNHCYSLVEGCDALAHLANSGQPYAVDQQGTLNDLLTMNTNIMVAACEAGVRKIVFASTVQVCSGSGYYEKEWQTVRQISYLPMDGHLPANPSNPYSTGKAMSEVLLQWLCRDHGISGVSIRFPMLYQQDWKSDFIRAISVTNARRNAPPMNPNEGMAALSYEDAVSLVLACLTVDLPGHRVYFPSGPWTGAMPLSELIEKYYKNIPVKKPLEELKGLVDISEITADTGWFPIDRLE